MTTNVHLLELTITITVVMIVMIVVMCITSGTYHDARHAFISAICWRHFRGVNKPLSFPQLLNTEMQLYIVVHVHTHNTHTHTHTFNMECINICLIIYTVLVYLYSSMVCWKTYSIYKFNI